MIDTMASGALGVTRLGGESWRDCVRRVSGQYGLDEECLEIFDRLIARGDHETEAAWCALYEWDCLALLP